MLRWAQHLPDRWKTLRFSLNWQDRVITIEMKKDITTFALTQGAEMPLIVYCRSKRIKFLFYNFFDM